MGNLIITALLAVIGSAIGRLLVGAGITLVVSGGVITIVNQLLNNAATQFQSLPINVVAIASIGGAFDGLAVVGGALVAKATLAGVGRIIGAKIT